MKDQEIIDKMIKALRDTQYPLKSRKIRIHRDGVTLEDVNTGEIRLTGLDIKDADVVHLSYDAHTKRYSYTAYIDMQGRGSDITVCRDTDVPKGLHKSVIKLWVKLLREIVTEHAREMVLKDRADEFERDVQYRLNLMLGPFTD